MTDRIVALDPTAGTVTVRARDRMRYLLHDTAPANLRRDLTHVAPADGC